MKRLFWVLILLILIVSGFLFWPRASNPQARASLLFIGFTNVPQAMAIGKDGWFQSMSSNQPVRHAIFCLTNTTSVPLDAIIAKIEFKPISGWTDPIIPKERIYLAGYAIAAELKPFQGSDIFIPCSTNIPWRLQADCRQATDGYPWNKDGFRDFKINIRTRSGIRTLGGPRYSIVSPEIPYSTNN